MLESSRKKLDPWLRAIKEYRPALDEPLEGPLSLEVAFYLPRPKTVKRPLPTAKPDVDKLLRGLLDGLKGFIEDDARVTQVLVQKEYETDLVGPGVRVVVYTNHRLYSQLRPSTTYRFVTKTLQNNLDNDQRDELEYY